MGKYRVAKATTSPIDKQENVVNTILSNMSSPQTGSRYGILLQGDPGVGKTSMTRQMARLLGLEILIIEAPHIIGEHIIQIPFIVYNPNDSVSANHTGNIQAKAKLDSEGEVSETDFDLVYSNSYLLQELKGKKKIADENYLEYIYKQDKHITKVFEDLGGTKEVIPEIISNARKHFKDILFIDEYFRAPSANIRNILRDMLNRQIGSEKIPMTTYLIYASNMKDEGLQGIRSTHQVFSEVIMDNPSASKWMAYMKSKHEDLSDKVVEAFEKIINDDKISFKDGSSEIRTSPRRWEQLVTYVNSSLPVKDAEEANALLASVRANFTNTDKATSELLGDVYSAVKKLIVDGNKDIDDADLETASKPNDDAWYNTMKHQIQQAIKMGDKRTYVPVIAGNPGIGKNKLIAQIAEELGMGLIMRSATAITKDSVIGVPVLKKKPKKGENVDFDFHTPPLLLGIKKEAKEWDAEFKKKGTKQNPKGKYLLYLDELDKVTDKDIFNVLRRVMLEKEFANGEKLPEGTVIISAINPTGTEGSTKFTSHMADVMDIIHATPSWSKFMTYMNDKFNIGEDDEEKYGKLKSGVIAVMAQMADRFKSSGKDGEYNLQDGSDTFYISPRDYENMVTEAVKRCSAEVTEFKHDMAQHEKETGEKITKEDMNNLSEGVKDACVKSFESVLRNSWRHKDLEPDDFFSKLEMWFKGDVTDVILKGITIQASETINQVKDVLEKMVNDKTFDPASEKYKRGSKERELADNFMAYIDNTDPVEFNEHIRDFIEEHIKAGDKEEVALHKPLHNYLDDEGKGHLTNAEGLVMELKNASRTSSKQEDTAKTILVDYLDNLMEHSPSFKKDFTKFIADQNKEEAKYPELPENGKYKKFVDEIMKDAPEKTKTMVNPTSPELRAIYKLIQTEKNGKYEYLQELIDNHGDWVVEPLAKSKTYKNAHKLLHSEEDNKPIETFVNRIIKALKEIGATGHYTNAVKEMEEKLKELEDEYLLKHIPLYKDSL